VDQPGLAKLGSANSKPSLFLIDVLVLKTKGFADAQARYSEQAKQTT
jgi:hypothetical protein